ncbi:MAG TPA: response regulator [Phycisphaerales bacterium]|nr:response regulator [Phycisphaerales bacterium]
MQNSVSILLVDDQPRNLDVLESILSSPEYELVRAQSAEQALLELLHREFAAIVLDIKMPGISGLELAQIIKKRKRTENIPILFLTAHLIEEQDVLRGYGAGAVDYLSKPINPDILKTKVAVFIDLYRKNRALADVNRQLQSEVDKREKAQEELRQANERLESRVHERTEDLTLANYALRDSEQRVRLLLESVGEGIFGIDHGGFATFVNPAAAQLLGYSPEELIGQPLAQLLPEPAPEVPQLPALDGAPLVSTPGPDHFFTRKDGTRFPVEFVRTPVRNERGVITGEVVVFRDLTSRHRASRRLAAEHAVTKILATAESLDGAADELLARLCETLDVSAAKMWVVEDAHVRCTACHVEADAPQLLGFKKEALGTRLAIGRGLSGKVAQTREPQWYGTLTGLSGLPWVDRAIAAGLHSALGFPVVESGRCEAVITMYSRDVAPPDESLIAMVGSIGREIGAFVRRTRAETELRAHREQLEEIVQQRTGALERSHERLRQAERLAAVGTLAAGLGHDMSNLLLPIRARLHSLAESGLAQQAMGDVAAIGEAVGYLQRLASGLRLLALDPDRITDQNTGTNLSAWWRDVEGVFRAALPRGVRLEGSAAPDLPVVSIPAARLTQAVFNLVQNAGEALATAPGRGADKGVIRISARPIAGEQDGSVELIVEDDGPGMTADVAARCFEPYFSTKTRVVSTGMGLAMVRAWVEGAGGSVILNTAPGRGAKFTLVLRPRTGAPTGDQAGRAPAAHAAITIEDKRTLSFVSVLIEASHARALAFDQEGVPDAELWVVGGAAATPERVAAFLAQDGARRAVVLEDLAPGARARDGHQPQIADPRVCYLGKKPGTSHLRKALVDALGVTRTSAGTPAPEPAEATS